MIKLKILFSELERNYRYMEIPYIGSRKITDEDRKFFYERQRIIKEEIHKIGSLNMQANK